MARSPASICRTGIAAGQVATIEDYGAVVLGSAVYAGRWLKQAQVLAERSAGSLAVRPVWLFSSGPVGDPAKPEEDPVDVAEIAEATHAREHRVFAGKLTKKQLSFPDRAIVLAFRVADGDFRDWAQIKDWASEIAGRVLACGVVPGQARPGLGAGVYRYGSP